jgi:hypothetical protein
VGYAICISCIVNAMTDLAVISWSGHAIFQLFNGQAFPENFFFGKVLVCILSVTSFQDYLIKIINFPLKKKVRIV